MNITFTRTGERTYKTLVTRERLTIQVPAFDKPTLLPDDLAHVIVEQGLGLQQGFWGRVAAGALFPGMTVLAGRQEPHAAERSQAILREAGQCGTEAEVYVSVLETIARHELDTDWPAARAELGRMWRPIRPSRDLPNHEEVKRVCTALREAERQWQALAVGESITITWSPGKRNKPPASRRPSSRA